jgi:hypothetical protein
VTELYESIADWWPVISPPSEYAEEAALYVEIIQGAARDSGSGPVREVLELGGGNNRHPATRRAGYCRPGEDGDPLYRITERGMEMLSEVIG